MDARTVSPLEALRTIADLGHAPPVREVETATCGSVWLAEDVTLSGDGRPGLERVPPFAAWNGYALPAGFSGGRCRVVSSEIARLEAGTMGDFEEDVDGALPVAMRVETGQALAPHVDRVTPIRDARVVGRNVVDIPPRALERQERGVCGPTQPATIPRGTRLDARLRAGLLARGVQRVRARLGWTAAFGTIGGELTDVTALGSEASRPPPGVSRTDSNGLWLPEALASLGLVPAPLGTIDDEPAAIAAALQRAARQGAQTVVLSGGVGDGLLDRTVEALREGPFRIAFERLALAPGGRIVYAQGLGLDVYALPGAPLETAALFDVVVAPAILAALGAPEAVWSWTAAPLELPSPPPARPRDTSESEWTLTALCSEPDAGSSGSPAGHGGGAGGDTRPATERRIELSAAARFIPALPGQTAWELCSPASEPPPRRYRVPRQA